ncbi:uncharacterized protein TA10475 [Theileria annulata]|uniref:Uncharacterized protein n=1 Tax=Theileria annulata TaxID=5874 RepID=Q4U8E9_THEAN|nr:uncharacterized protein TA10475 [Theileria annulata]CAI76904.1 hypothetical protein TA10475 [Theileria annulata]|eukprot:XP_953529.1 hypothetical protein TA10475 [Theileria annulata]
MTEKQSSSTNPNKNGFEDFINKLQKSTGVSDIHQILCKLIVGFVSMLSCYINDQINVSSSLYGRGFRIPPNNLSIYISKLHSYRSLLMMVACFLYYIINLMIIDFCPKNFVNIVRNSFSLFFIYLLIISRFMLFFFSFFTPSISLRIYYILIIEGAFSGFLQMSVILLVPQYSSIMVISKDIIALLLFLIQLFYDFILSHKPLIMIRIQFFVSVLLNIIGFGLWAFYLFYYNKNEPESHTKKNFDFDSLNNINKTIKNLEKGVDITNNFVCKISKLLNGTNISELNMNNITNELNQKIENVASLDSTFRKLEYYIKGENCIKEFIEKLKEVKIYNNDLIDILIQVANQLDKNADIDKVLSSFFEKFNGKITANNFIFDIFEEIRKEKKIDLEICKLFDESKKEFKNQDDKAILKNLLKELKSKNVSKKSSLQLLIYLKQIFYKKIMSRYKHYNNIDEILSLINSFLIIYTEFIDKNLHIYVYTSVRAIIKSLQNIGSSSKYNKFRDKIKTLMDKLDPEDTNVNNNEVTIYTNFNKLSELFSKIDILRTNINDLESTQIINDNKMCIDEYINLLKSVDAVYLYSHKIDLSKIMNEIKELYSKYEKTENSSNETLESIKLKLPGLLDNLNKIKEYNDNIQSGFKDLKSSYSNFKETEEQLRNILFVSFRKALCPFLMIVPTCFFKDFLYPSILPFALLLRSESHYINIVTNIFHIVFCLAIFFIYLYSFNIMDYVWDYFDYLWLISIIPSTILIITLLAIHTKIGVFHRITLSLRKVFVLSLFYVLCFTVMESISYVCVADYVYKKSGDPTHNLKYLLFHHLLALFCSYIFSKLSVGYNHTRIELGHVAPYYQTELDLTNLQVFWFLIRGTFKSTFRDILFFARTDIREYL